MGVECVLVGPRHTKATSQYRDHEQQLNELRGQGAHMCNQTRQEEDDESIVADPNEGEESEEEGSPNHTPMGERSEDGGGELLTQQSDRIGLPRTMKSTATPLVRNLEKGWKR